MNFHSPERSLKPVRPDLMPTAKPIRSQTTKRRSSRMALNARVELSGEDRQKSHFSLLATATNLNKHGAAVQLQRELRVGATVVVQNLRGTVVPARVVTQLATSKGVPTYAIEFIEQDKAKNFWGISFPSNG